MVDLPYRWRLAARDTFGNKRERQRQARTGEVFGVLIWNREAGEGEVLLDPHFAKHCRITRMDAYKDVIGLMDHEYEGELITPREGDTL